MEKLLSISLKVNDSSNTGCYELTLTCPQFPFGNLTNLAVLFDSVFNFFLMKLLRGVKKPSVIPCLQKPFFFFLGGGRRQSYFFLFSSFFRTYFLIFV